MKLFKYIFVLLCLSLTGLASAQVVEFHVNEKYYNDGQNYVHKFYLSDVDSIVYVPALDWTPTIEVKDFYQDEQEQTHVHLHVTTGPDADFGRLYYGVNYISSRYFSDIEQNPELDTLTNYIVIDKGSDLEMDFVVPDPTQKYRFILYTANLRHFSIGGRYYYDATCDADYAYWLENKDWTAWASTPSEFSKAGGTGEFPLGEAGTGTYKYSIMWSDEVSGMFVYFRQNKINPNISQFKITYEFDEFIIDAEWDENLNLYRLFYPETFTGYTHPNYGKVFASDYITYYAKRNWSELTWDVLYNNNLASSYDPDTGTFTFYLYYYVDAGYFGYGSEIFQVDGFPDYTTTAQFIEIQKATAEGEKNQAVIEFTLGPDVAWAEYAMTSTSMSEQEAAEAIIAKTLASTKITQSSQVRLPLEEEGTYRVTVVAFNSNGAAKAQASCDFTFVNEDNWQSLGMGQYTDDFMTMGSYDNETDEWSSIYNGLEPQTYSVEVFENTKTPGLYRLKNAYGYAYPYNEEGDWDASMDYYLEINATDPNNVFIKKQALGLDWGYGMISVESDGAYYMEKYGLTPAQITAALESDVFGKLANGVITFPEDVFMVSFGDYEFYGNHNGAFKLVLPGYAGNAQSAPRKAPVLKKKEAVGTLLPANEERLTTRKTIFRKKINDLVE